MGLYVWVLLVRLMLVMLVRMLLRVGNQLLGIGLMFGMPLLLGVVVVGQRWKHLLVDVRWW